MRKITFLIIEMLFISVIILYRNYLVPLTGFDLLVFALATFRLARSVSFNGVGELIREPFTETKKDSCQAGDNIHPKGVGTQRVIGELISCPICTGQWVAIILYGLWIFVPEIGRSAVYLLAIAGAAEYLHWIAELFEWGGRAARVVSGCLSPDEE